MSVKILKRDAFKVSTWSGGTTTELFIYPDEAKYKERNFLFRLSSATVDADFSIFTKLPDVSRIITILDGEIVINHENHYSKSLKKHDTDIFEGDWNTTSRGKARDFNLMMKNGVVGSVKVLSIKGGEHFFELEKDSKFDFIYISSGDCSIIYKNENHLINSGDMVVFDGEEALLKLICESETTFVYCKVDV